MLADVTVAAFVSACDWAAGAACRQALSAAGPASSRSAPTSASGSGSGSGSGRASPRWSSPLAWRSCWSPPSASPSSRAWRAPVWSPAVGDSAQPHSPARSRRVRVRVVGFGRGRGRCGGGECRAGSGCARRRGRRGGGCGARRGCRRAGGCGSRGRDQLIEGRGLGGLGGLRGGLGLGRRGSVGGRLALRVARGLRGGCRDGVGGVLRGRAGRSGHAGGRGCAGGGGRLVGVPPTAALRAGSSGAPFLAFRNGGPGHVVVEDAGEGRSGGFIGIPTHPRARRLRVGTRRRVRRADGCGHAALLRKPLIAISSSIRPSWRAASRS